MFLERRAPAMPPGGPYGRYGLISLWVESIVYGLYFPLFLVAFNIMRKRDGLRTSSSKFLLGGLTLMFILISINTAFTLVTMLKLYIPSVTPSVVARAAPAQVAVIPMPWDVYAFIIILTFIGWITDVIMIFRVFLVWSRNFYVIILPCAVLIVSMCAGTFNFWYSKHPTEFPTDKAQLFRGLFFPMSMINSMLTTGLISLRIWMQHRRMNAATGKSGTPGGQTSLFLVLRIVIESAMIWTAHMIIICVMFYTEHQAVIIVKHSALPSAGVVFALIAIRTQYARVANETSETSDRTRSKFGIPAWLTGNDTSQSRTTDAESGNQEKIKAGSVNSDSSDGNKA